MAQRAALDGLGGYLIGLLLVMGAGLAESGPLAYAGAGLPLHLAAALATAAHMLFWPILALLFNRALARSPIRPAWLA